MEVICRRTRGTRAVIGPADVSVVVGNFKRHQLDVHRPPRAVCSYTCG